jgi:hypothetical protein
MAAGSVEQRLSSIEKELAEIKEALGKTPSDSAIPWWDHIYGSFADNKEYDEAMRLGREYRDSLRPVDDSAS